MICRWCGKGPLEQRGHKTRLFCNASCRNKAWQRQFREKLRQNAKAETQAEQERRLQSLAAALAKEVGLRPEDL